jgi:hypothetical protein
MRFVIRIAQEENKIFSLTAAQDAALLADKSLATPFLQLG